MSPLPTKPEGEKNVDSWLLAKVSRTQTPESPEVVAFNRQAEAFLVHHVELQRALSGRLKLVRFVLSVFQQPRSQWPLALHDLREDHAGLARAILERLALHPELVRELLIAIDRYEDAGRAAAEVRTARSRIAAAPPGLKAALIERIAFPKLKGRLYLLTTFDATFQHDPVLSQLFPPIDRTKRPKRPPAASAPPPPAPKGESLTRTLQEGVERLLKGR